ncbi:hypothetical protein LINPERPRIM_LOCUS9836 [Linum perenne]
MSSDLNLRSTAPAASISSSNSINDDDDDRSSAIVKSNSAADDQDQQPLAVIKNINEDPDCETPLTEEFKIPEAICCPAAPKKPKRISTSVACKRKLLSEFDLFDMINGEDVDALFRSSFQAVEKRRCATPIPL